MLTIFAPKRGSKYPLMFRRFGELPLPAYIELKLEDRVVTFTYWDRNTEPMYVTLGHSRRWEIDCKISRLAAIKLAKELEPLLERLCNGYTSRWDGRNHVGVLNADARAAAEEVRSRLKECLRREAA